MPKIFFPEQPKVVVSTIPNNSGSGPPQWVNTNCLFKEEGKDEVVRGQFTGDFVALVNNNIGKAVEVTGLRFIEKANLYKIQMPRATPPQGGSVSRSGGGGYNDAYRGAVMTPEQYFQLINGAYKRILTDVKTVAFEMLGAEVGPAGLLEAAQQLTLQYVIALQRNMISLGAPSLPATTQPVENTAPDDIVGLTLQKIKHLQDENNGVLPAEYAHVLVDGIKGSQKLNSEQKMQLVMALVEAQSAHPTNQGE